MEKLTRSIKMRPIQLLSVLFVVLGMMLFPANSFASELEGDIKLENWMITPFESDVVEFELQMENWMITPFETEFVEFDISLEDWMISAWI